MTNLIRSDFYKLRKAKYFWTCFMINIFLAAAMVFILDFTYKIAGEQMAAQMEQQQEALNDNGVNITTNGMAVNYDDLSASGQMLTFLSDATVTLLLAVLISLFAGGEFSYGTIKNIASRNYSRRQIYLSKLIVSIMIAISFMLIYTAVATVTATVLWGFGALDSGFWIHFLKAAGIELLLGSAFASVFVMFSILIRQNGGSLAANICFLEFVSLLAMIGEILIKKITGRTFAVSNYLLDINMQQVAADLTRTTAIRGICVALIFFLAAMTIGMINFNHRDIK